MVSTSRNWIYTRPDKSWQLLRRDGRAQTDSTFKVGEIIDAWADFRGAAKTGTPFLVLVLRTGQRISRAMQTEFDALEAARQIRAHLHGGWDDETSS